MNSIDEKRLDGYSEAHHDKALNRLASDAYRQSEDRVLRSALAKIGEAFASPRWTCAGDFFEKCRNQYRLDPDLGLPTFSRDELYRLWKEAGQLLACERCKVPTDMLSDGVCRACAKLGSPAQQARERADQIAEDDRMERGHA